MNSPPRTTARDTAPRLVIALLSAAIAAFHAGPSRAADAASSTAGAASSAPGAASPIGEWKTFDDKTGQARAIVRIYEQNGKLFGKIEQSFTPGAEHRVCAVCTDERKNQPVLGLVIIRNMTRADDGYAGGDILDPDSGSVYRCKMHVDAGGAKLVVRGFIGISLLGRTQTWERQRSP